MKVALLILSTVTDDVVTQCKPTLTIRSNYDRLDKQLADAAIQLEEKTLLEQTPIDSVLVILKDYAANYNNQTPVSDTVHYLGTDRASAFYCQPEVLYTIGNLYKMDFNDYKFKNLDHDTPELLSEKILFVANRLGYNIDVKNS